MTDTPTLTDKAKKTLATGMLGASMVLGTAEAEDNKAINAQILADAERNSAQIIKQSENRYSKDLQALENRFSHASPVIAEQLTVVVIDPVKAVVGNALNRPPLESYGQRIPADIFTKETRPEDITAFLNQETTTAGIHATPSKPEIPSRFCLVNPTSEISPITLSGLTQKEKETYINGHETWHCSEKASASYTIAEKNARATTPDTERLMDNKDALFVETQKREAYADLGIAGDMIRSGSPLSIIDKIHDWRTNRAEGDVVHDTSGSLAALKDKIEEMGLEQFKALTPKQAQALYASLKDENAISKDDVRHARENPAASKADTVFDLDHSAATTAAVRDWDYKGELQKKALAIGFEISPASLLKAYSLRQDEFRQEIQLHPESEKIVAAKMAYLADNIKGVVQTTDYVAVNKEHGVKFTMASGMSKFLHPAEEATKPDSHPARTSSNASLKHSL